MVCITINRDPLVIDDEQAKRIRDSFHRAAVKCIKVKSEDVEVRVRDISALDLNSSKLAVEIDSGPGKDSWRIEECRAILLGISASVAADVVVPRDLWKKGESNLWLRIYAKGASMPLDCPDLIH